MIAAVIGHGLSPVGKGWGVQIDACTPVIRMWNWHWQDQPDWGKRYDYGFYEISPAEMARFYKHNCRRPTHGWIGSILKEFDGSVPTPSEIIDPDPWVEIAIAMGGHGAGTKRLKLTRGARAAAWIIEHVQAPATVVLVGFDNLVGGVGLSPEEGFPEAYRACPAMFPFRDYTGGTVRYRSHDYGIEGPFLQALADKYGLELVHAQEIW